MLARRAAHTRCGGERQHGAWRAACYEPARRPWRRWRRGGAGGEAALASTQPAPLAARALDLALRHLNVQLAYAEFLVKDVATAARAIRFEFSTAIIILLLQVLILVHSPYSTHRLATIIPTGALGRNRSRSSLRLLLDFACVSVRMLERVVATIDRAKKDGG